MKRFVSIAVVAAFSLAGAAQAQVIGTYRPSTVTYYSGRNIAPASYQQPVAASYTPASYNRTAVYASQPASAPVVPVSYPVAAPVSSTPYYSAPLRTVSYGGAPCGCSGVQTTAFAPPITTIAAPAVAIPALPPGTIDNEYFVGQGLLGRPKVFKTGQPVRNFVRRILP